MMAPILAWQLREYCKVNNISPDEVDSRLEYDEARKELERKFGPFQNKPAIYERRGEIA